MVKKVICIALSGVMMASLFAGCKSGNQATNQNTGTTSATSIVSKPTTLKLSFWEPGTSQEMQKALEAVVQEYKKVQPDIKIELLSQPYNGYQDWIKARFAANEAPDIEENHSNILEDQFRNGMLHNLKTAYNSPNPYAENKVWKDLFQDGRIESAHLYTYEPSFAVPFTGLGLGYYYNKDIYQKLGLSVPKTWDEFMSNCQKIKEANYNPISMMMMKKDAVDWLAWYVFTGLYANKYLASPDLNPNGDKVIADQELARAIELGKFNVTQGEERKIFEKYLDTVEQYSKYAEGASGLDEAGAKAQFLAGKAAHLMSGSWDIKSFIIEPSSKINIGVFSFPKFTKQNGEFAGDNMCISSVECMAITQSVKDSEDKKKAAEDFMMFLTAPQYYKIFVENSFTVPVVKSVDVDPAFNVFNEGSVEPLGIFNKTGKLSKTNMMTVTFSAASGKPYDRNKLLEEYQKSALEFVKEVKEKYKCGPENDFGIKELPKKGEFKPTE